METRGMSGHHRRRRERNHMSHGAPG